MLILFGYCCCGYILELICNFCEMIGVNCVSGVVDIGMFEFSICDYLDVIVLCVMCVLKLFKVVIINYFEGQVENFELLCYLKEDMGVCVLLFGCELFIDVGDFEEVLLVGYKCLIFGGEVCLCGSYVICVDEVIKDVDGNIVELCCSYDLDILGKNLEGCKVKGVIYWVLVEGSVECEVCLYDWLFCLVNLEKVEEGGSFFDNINVDFLQVLIGCCVELLLGQVNLEDCFQFECEGYFVVDLKDFRLGKLVFNCIVILCDFWGQG